MVAGSGENRVIEARCGVRAYMCWHGCAHWAGALVQTGGGGSGSDGQPLAAGSRLQAVMPWPQPAGHEYIYTRHRALIPSKYFPAASDWHAYDCRPTISRSMTTT